MKNLRPKNCRVSKKPSLPPRPTRKGRSEPCFLPRLFIHSSPAHPASFAHLPAQPRPLLLMRSGRGSCCPPRLLSALNSRLVSPPPTVSRSGLPALACSFPFPCFLHLHSEPHPLQPSPPDHSLPPRPAP